MSLGNPDRPVGGLAVPRPAGVEIRPLGRDDFGDRCAALLARELYGLGAQTPTRSRTAPRTRRSSPTSTPRRSWPSPMGEPAGLIVHRLPAAPEPRHLRGLGQRPVRARALPRTGDRPRAARRGDRRVAPARRPPGRGSRCGRERTAAASPCTRRPASWTRASTSRSGRSDTRGIATGGGRRDPADRRRRRRLRSASPGCSPSSAARRRPTRSCPRCGGRTRSTSAARTRLDARPPRRRARSASSASSSASGFTTAPQAWIPDLIVTEAARGRDIGAALLDARLRGVDRARRVRGRARERSPPDGGAPAVRGGRHDRRRQLPDTPGSDEPARVHAYNRRPCLISRRDALIERRRRCVDTSRSTAPTRSTRSTPSCGASCSPRSRPRARDEATRAVVITGAGAASAAGADLRGGSGERDFRARPVARVQPAHRGHPRRCRSRSSPPSTAWLPAPASAWRWPRTSSWPPRTRASSRPSTASAWCPTPGWPARWSARSAAIAPSRSSWASGSSARTEAHDAGPRRRRRPGRRLAETASELAHRLAAGPTARHRPHQAAPQRRRGRDAGRGAGRRGRAPGAGRSDRGPRRGRRRLRREARPALQRPMNEIHAVGVLGAGTMGAGIAQVAAEAGLDVLVHDPVDGATERALRAHRRLPAAQGREGPARRERRRPTRWPASARWTAWRRWPRPTW